MNLKTLPWKSLVSSEVKKTECPHDYFCGCLFNSLRDTHKHLIIMKEVNTMKNIMLIMKLINTLIDNYVER